MVGLLAIALAAAPFGRHVAVYPMQHPDGRDAEAQVLGNVIETALLARGAVLDTAPADAYAACTTPVCLKPRAEASTSVGAIVPRWVTFGDGAVLSAVAQTDGSPAFLFELSVPAPKTSDLPAAAAELARLLGDRFALPIAADVRPPEEEHDTFGLALKLGNTVGSLTPKSPTSVNARFDLEGDYLAAPEFWPFIDLSLVLAHDSNGNSVNLVPVLLGAKYVFRHTKSLRPFAGMALGLDFLSANPDADTGTSSAFAVYAQGGVDWFVFEHVALVAEASANLNGLQASGQTGLLFTLGFNFGATVLF